jgi:hypothetical protein
VIDARIAGFEVVTALLTHAVEVVREEVDARNQGVGQAGRNAIILLLAGGEARGGDGGAGPGVDAARQITGLREAEEARADDDRARRVLSAGKPADRLARPC